MTRLALPYRGMPPVEPLWFEWAALAGCGRAPASGFFLIDAGHRWTCDVKTEHGNNTVNHETLTLRTLGSDPIEGGRAWRRRSESGGEITLELISWH